MEIDTIGAGEQSTMGRPDGARELRGPMAAALAERLNGSSAEISAAGREVGGSSSPLDIQAADERVTEAIPSVIRETLGEDGAQPSQDRAVLEGTVNGG